MKATVVNVMDESADDPQSWGGHRLHVVSVCLEFDREVRPRTAERLVADALRKADEGGSR